MKATYVTIPESHCFRQSKSFSEKSLFTLHYNVRKMNWFGKKKESPSTVSATSSRPVSNPQSTMVKLRENISTQEKR